MQFCLKYLNDKPENELVALTFVLQKFSTTTFKQMKSSMSRSNTIMTLTSARFH